MRAFAMKGKATHAARSSNTTRFGQARSAQAGAVNDILHLQRTIGNQAVQRLFAAHTNEGNSTGAKLQAKLTVNTPGDIYEQEADRLSEQVMRMPEPSQQSTCSGGERRDSQKEQPVPSQQRVQTKGIESSGTGLTAAPAIVHEALSSPGQPLSPATRAFMESRFGHDFSGVRVHTDPVAAHSAKAVAAQAYTLGSDIVFGDGRYAPESRDGQRLLAHELSHVVQQQDAGASSTLQRFETSEAPKIAPTFSDMLVTIKKIIDASSSSSVFGDDLQMGTFVEKAGGSSLKRKLGKKLSLEPATVKSMLLPRYLFTCRCGLIDMRHFIQLLYLSHVMSGFGGISQNRAATRQGREHELSAESKSRFSAEDMPSNALGAFTSVGLVGLPGPDDVFDAIKDTLTRCSPIDFKSLSAASQNTIIHYYGDLAPDPAPEKPGDLVPLHQSMSAVPSVLDVKECGGERSFPFKLDTDDSDLKTISGRDFLKGSTNLTSGKDIRAFINTQRQEVLRALPTSEKIRMLRVLLGGEVSDEDLRAATRLSKMMTSAEDSKWKESLPLGPGD